jgi:hypothetical protein
MLNLWRGQIACSSLEFVMIIWLLGQFRWSSCNNFALTSIVVPVHCLSRRLYLTSRGGGDVKHIFMGGLGGQFLHRHTFMSNGWELVLACNLCLSWYHGLL